MNGEIVWFGDCTPYLTYRDVDASDYYYTIMIASTYVTVTYFSYFPLFGFRMVPGFIRPPDVC